MFNQIGEKIKAAAWAVLLLGAAVVIVVGIMRITAGAVLTGILMLIAGLAASLLGAWVVYAIGETADSVRALQIENEQLRRQNEVLVTELKQRNVLPQTLPLPELQPETHKMPDQDEKPASKDNKDKKKDKKDAHKEEKNKSDKVEKKDKKDKKNHADESKKIPGIASEILSYALRFNTTEGMKAYLMRAAQTANPAVQVLKPLLEVPDDRLREEAEKLMKKI